VLHLCRTEEQVYQLTVYNQCSERDGVRLGVETQNWTRSYWLEKVEEPKQNPEKQQEHVSREGKSVEVRQ
jgi:hypothetical protein